MKRLRILKWSILISIIVVAIVSLILISIYSRSVFNYLYLVLATLGSYLGINYIFKQKEDGMPLEEQEMQNKDK